MEASNRHSQEDAYEALMRIIKNRRSCRRFTDTPVDPETLRKVIEAAIWAPSGCNQQEVRFVLTTDRTDLQALLKAKKVINPQAAVLVYTDTDSTYYKGWWDDRHKARLQYFDSAAAVMNLLLAAESLGLAALWVNISPYWQGAHGENTIELYRRFDTPNTLKLQGAVYLGYPAVEVDLQMARWHDKPVMRGPVDNYIVHVPKKTAILHYQTLTHDNMGSRALSEGLLNLACEKMGDNHWIRIFDEYPASRLLNKRYLGPEPATAIERFDRLADEMTRRLKHAHVVPEDTFGKYFVRSRLRNCRFYNLIEKIVRRLPLSSKNPNDIYSAKKEIGRLRLPSVQERQAIGLEDLPKLMVGARMKFTERLLGRIAPRIWGLRHIEKRLFELARFDTVIYNGNGYLADYYGEALTRRLFELHLATKMGKEVTACNLSVDLKDRMLRGLVAHVFNRIDKIVVREPLSRDELVEYGVEADRLLIGADAAIFCSIEPCGDVSRFFGGNQLDPAKHVALIIRGDRGHSPQDWAVAVAEIRQQLGLEVALLSSSLEQDSRLITEVARLSDAPVMTSGTNHARFIDLLSHFRLVISERYHPCVFCIRTQTPVVPLTGNTLKTAGLFSLFSYSIPVLSPDTEEKENRQAIVQAASHALENESMLRDELAIGNRILRSEAAKNLDSLVTTGERRASSSAVYGADRSLDQIPAEG